MRYDRGDSFPFDFEPNGISFFGSKPKGKLSPRSYPIQCERKWKHIFLSVDVNSVFYQAVGPGWSMYTGCAGVWEPVEVPLEPFDTIVP